MRRLEQRHLQDLGALLLAAGEAFVQIAGGERVVHLQHRHLLAHQAAELARGERLGLTAVAARSPRRGRSRTFVTAMRRKFAIETPGMTVGYWNARKRPLLGALVRRPFEDVLTHVADASPRSLRRQGCRR